MFDDPTLVAAYRGETEQLNAERLPLAVALCLALVGLSGAFEQAFYPEHLGIFLGAYAFEVAAFAPLLLGRRALLRRGWLQRVNVATWCTLVLSMHAYGAAAALPVELSVLGGVCLVIGSSLLMPWGVRAQAAIVGASLAACTALLLTQSTTHLPGAYLIFIELAAGVISLFGAHYLDLHRFALFCEATRREEEAGVSQSLVAIAKEINDSLDADDVLDRIAAVTRSALHATWSVIVLRDAQRDCFVIVGSAGPVPDDLVALRDVEFGVGVLPLADRILAEHELLLRDAAGDGGLPREWQTRALFGAALRRRDTVVGLLLAGSRAEAPRFSERGRDLFAGIAQHVAIALNNVRLVADLRRANELKSEFLSTMSHELRTPLNVIIGYADLLRDEAFGSVAAEQSEVLGRLRTNADSLLELINATLEVNRIEAGRSAAHLREVDLRQLVTELQLETEHLPRQSGVTVRWDASRASDVIRTDPVKLKIVVRNLIGNALKFTRRGSVAVQMGFDARSKVLDVLVRDTGPGIAPDHLTRIFDMFHQGPSESNPGGVGLGLYIVKRFVELLGGRVSVTSRLNEGATFRVSVPAGMVAAPASLEEHRLRRSA